MIILCLTVYSEFIDYSVIQYNTIMIIGMSTVLYTVTAVHLTVSIRPLAVPYLSCTHLLESPRQYGTVTITAVYGWRRVVWDSIV